MSHAFELSDGGALTPVAFTKDVLRVISPRAFAPGAPVAFTARFEGEGEVSLEGRVVGVRRRADGSYDLSLRMVNLRREHRKALANLGG